MKPIVVFSLWMTRIALRGIEIVLAHMTTYPNIDDPLGDELPDDPGAMDMPRYSAEDLDRLIPWPTQ